MNKKRIKELEVLVTDARNHYYNGTPVVSDRVFDAWLDELRDLDSKSPAVINVGAPTAPSVWKKAKHDIPMGSLDKVNTPDELRKWVSDVCPTEDLFVSEKLDGISIELVYEEGMLVQAITRGDGETGEDITVNVVKMGGVPRSLSKNFNGSFRGEIILTKTNHQKYFADKANPRNAASGVAKRLDGVGVENLDVLLYQVIGDLDFKSEEEQFNFLLLMGCKTPNFKILHHSASAAAVELAIQGWTEYQKTFREKLDYDIDGLVIRINDLAKQMELGDKDLRPLGAIAFKFENEARESTIKDIIWQVGNSGRVTPVAIVDPVKLVGATVSRASIYNIAYIEELQLDIGAKVLVARANDVIPRIEELVKGTGKTAQAPKNCPICGGKLVMDGENLSCTNIDGCQAQIIGRVKNWVAELNILELGDTLIEKLVGAGLVKDPSDLYILTVNELSKLDRMGDKSALNVYDSLWKNNPVALELFLGALSIPMIGASTIKLLIEAGYDSLHSIMNMSESQMEAIKGLGPVKASSLFLGLKKNESLIKRLLDNGVLIKDKITGSLSGKSLCFTGAMKNKRPVLEQMAIDAGGSIKSSVGKGLTYLVIGDVNSTSSKAVAARKLGTTLISEDDFLKMV